MRLLIAFACVACCVSSLAFAEDEVKLTIGKCLEINGALAALDEGTFDYVVKDASGKETIAHPKFKLGDARGPIALNRTAMLPIVKSAQETSNKLVEEIAGEGKQITRFIDPDKPDKGETAQWKDYSAKMLAFSERPCPITFARIKRGDLKPSDANPIPGSSVLTLEPILD